MDIYLTYLIGLGLRLLVRWVEWSSKTKRRWWTWPYYDCRGAVTLGVVGAGVAAAWTKGLLLVVAAEYLPVDLSGLVVTAPMSVMVGYMLALVICRQFKLKGIE